MLALVALGGGIKARQTLSGRGTGASATFATAGISEDSRVADKDRLYDDIIAEAASTYDVDPNLLRAIIRAESGFDPKARSAAGAEGLMQLMPFLSRELGVKDPYDPRDNILGGARYLSRMLERNDGDVALALASYNAGPQAVRRHKGIPPYKETRGYVKKVTTMMADSQEPEAGTRIALGD